MGLDQIKRRDEILDLHLGKAGGDWHNRLIRRWCGAACKKKQNDGKNILHKFSFIRAKPLFLARYLYMLLQPTGTFMLPDFASFLKTRRSVKPKAMTTPGPTSAQLEEILKIATRVPDHGKYAPWYFIIFEGDAGIQAGEKLAELYAAANADTTQAQLDNERTRFSRVPTVIAVVSRIREGKNSQWEQILSAGAACYNLCLAANALGFATNWLTEWYSYDPAFKNYLGIAPADNIAGFIYIGTSTETPEDRDRPDLSRIVTRWTHGTPLNTGEGYGQTGKGYPEKGFETK